MTTIRPRASRPAPAVTDVNRPFWTGGRDGRLLIQRCPCGRWVHPPAPTCPGCGSAELRFEPVSGRGTVFTFTVNRHPFNPEVPVPYVIAIVELDEQAGLRFTTNIVGCDPDAVSVGMPVTVAFEEHGELFIPVFTPIA
jgi:uncharacterized OB-fold protein